MSCHEALIDWGDGTTSEGLLIDLGDDSVAVSAGGACKTVKTTPLLTIEEGMDAMKKAATCGYKPVRK